MTKLFNSIIPNHDDNYSEKRGISMQILNMTILSKNTGAGNTPLRQEREGSLLWPALLISIAALLVITAPASAGEQYMSGSPELSVYLGGTNEFSPGHEAQLAVVFENS
jgi:hypothetical protein